VRIHLEFLFTTKTGILIVQTSWELIRPKGYMMSTHKRGLHKDVSVIFDGVWDPEIDNVQPPFEEPAADDAAYILPGSMAANNWPKEARSITIATVFKAPANIFSPKRRKEKKRLLSISKHLLINRSS
jgi:hypothetical protein